jgi:Lon-like protease
VLLRALTPVRLLVAALLVIIAAVLFMVTRGSNDYLEVPDNAHSLQGAVHVSGASDDSDGGGIYYVDVIVKRASLLESLIPALRPEGSDMIPRDALFEPGISEQERIKLALAEMKLSQVTASTVALRALGHRIKARLGGVRVVSVTSESHAQGILKDGDVIVSADNRPVRDRADLGAVLATHRVGDSVRLGIRRRGERRTVTIRTTSDETDPKRPIIGVIPIQVLSVRFPFKIKIDIGKVGGPSAGLAFALELLEQSGRDVDHGLKVAATGELNLDGSVTRIGGIKQKTIGARDSNVDVFLVPADGDNARDAKRYAHGLRIIPVESFQQALQVLATTRPKS